MTTHWNELTDFQLTLLVAEHLCGWRWVPCTFYDAAPPDDQRWLLPNWVSVADLTPGEWTYYDEDEDGQARDNRRVPGWITGIQIPDVFQAIEQRPEEIRQRFICAFLTGRDPEQENWRAYRPDQAFMTLNDLTTLTNARVKIAALRAVGVQIEGAFYGSLPAC